MQAAGAGVTMQAPRTRRAGDAVGHSPDELGQLPGLHQAVGQVGILLPAVLSVQLARGGGQSGCDPHASTCPAPRIPANPPSPSRESLWGLADPSVFISPFLGAAWDDHPTTRPGCGSLPAPVPFQSNMSLNWCIVPEEMVQSSGESKENRRRGSAIHVPLLPIIPPVLGPPLECSRGLRRR